MSEFQYFQFERYEPGIQVVRISRPEALNAINEAVLREFYQALEQIGQDSSVRVLILTGEGEKAFIAGADIKEMKEKTSGEGVSFSQLGHQVTKGLQTMPQPVIAAVNGFALGGGTEMAIACDFILANEKAVFGQPEVGLGIIPGFGGTIRLASFVGWPKAKELIFTGRKVKANEAKSIGLVNEIYSNESFFEKVLETARVISQNSRSAVGKAKQIMNEFEENRGANYKSDVEIQSFSRLFDTHDQKEGMSAFIEKRKPDFEGLGEKKAEHQGDES